MNNNDIRIFEKEGSTLTVKEYSILELAQQEISAVEVNGSHIEVTGKKRNRNQSYLYSLGWFITGRRAITQMCNSFKDTHRQPKLTDIHVRTTYKPAGKSGLINSRSFLLVILLEHHIKTRGWPENRSAPPVKMGIISQMPDRGTPQSVHGCKCYPGRR